MYVDISPVPASSNYQYDLCFLEMIFHKILYISEIPSPIDYEL